MASSCLKWNRESTRCSQSGPAQSTLFYFLVSEINLCTGFLQLYEAQSFSSRNLQDHVGADDRIATVGEYLDKGLRKHLQEDPENETTLKVWKWRNRLQCAIDGTYATPHLNKTSSVLLQAS